MSKSSGTSSSDCKKCKFTFWAIQVGLDMFKHRGSLEITLPVHILFSCVLNLHKADGIVHSVMSADIAVLCSCVL